MKTEPRTAGFFLWCEQASHGSPRRGLHWFAFDYRREVPVFQNRELLNRNVCGKRWLKNPLGLLGLLGLRGPKLLQQLLLWKMRDEAGIRMMAGLAGFLKELKPGWLGIPQAVKPASFVNGFVGVLWGNTGGLSTWCEYHVGTFKWKHLSIRIEFDFFSDRKKAGHAERLWFEGCQNVYFVHHIFSLGYFVTLNSSQSTLW